MLRPSVHMLPGIGWCGQSAMLRPSVHMLPGIGWCGQSAVLRPSVHMLPGIGWCGQSAVLRPSVHMLPGIGWCGAGLLPFPTTCWWLTHSAAITGVSVATRWNSPGGCGGLSVPFLWGERPNQQITDLHFNLVVDELTSFREMTKLMVS